MVSAKVSMVKVKTAMVRISIKSLLDGFSYGKIKHKKEVYGTDSSY